MSVDSLSGAVTALRHAGATLAEAGARLNVADPGPLAFGGDGPGALGELGRALYHQWQRALDARAREAAAHGARLADTGDILARSASGYAEIDEENRRRHPEVSP